MAAGCDYQYTSPYSHGNGRELLYEFYEQLTQFITQLYIASENQQLTKPITLYSDFFDLCPIDYVRRELSDFAEAGIGHDGQYPNGFQPWQAFMAYNRITICFAWWEAAYRLYTDQQTQCVLRKPNQQPVQVADAVEASLVSMPIGFAAWASES